MTKEVNSPRRTGRMLPLMVQPVSVSRAAAGISGRRRWSGGVAADFGIGQRGRAAVVDQAAALTAGELPVTVQLVSEVVPRMLNRPPP